ncbi:hypothetical protein HELRODRAFT_91967 [Helobdella robusta]|uniref:Dipeptidyl peptidase 1 n=1 Tax=Helobdella robusta TaxID=6412 RepID=T1G8B1_HELRO|nr:hypothetical protein HELRODRAFT_91967 [Helobdella robusta]ESO10294.1 hypothetical protein HELRODRAFT_91967 [Helobdella robusta]
MVSSLLALSLFLFVGAGLSVADTPVSCMYEDIRGKWVFYVGNGGYDNNINCSTMGYEVSKILFQYKLELKYPNIVIDEFNNEGTWTMIYDEGFEVTIHNRKFFAFSKFTGNMFNSTSFCNETFPGWSHDVFGRDWACYYGNKMAGDAAKSSESGELAGSQPVGERLYRSDPSMIEKINSDSSILWWAAPYEKFEKMTVNDMKSITGGHNTKKLRPPKLNKQPNTNDNNIPDLPDNWDWRNVSGVNYVTPVRNQAVCGSCYAFSSVGMCESRLAIATGNQVKVIFSPQDILDCSSYSQACDGGFPYLVAGKYAEDFGLVEEKCNPYQEFERETCDKVARQNCTKYYFTGYQYIGGYFGGCTEQLMREALVKHGPMSVAFQVYDDFVHYKGGIYHHTGLSNRFIPFEWSNHAVLLVGYGRDEKTKTNYWIIKNSWGEEWGEKGYFRIKRGTDECAVESLASQTFPIF